MVETITTKSSDEFTALLDRQKRGELWLTSWTRVSRKNGWLVCEVTLADPGMKWVESKRDSQGMIRMRQERIT